VKEFKTGVRFVVSGPGEPAAERHDVGVLSLLEINPKQF
jgi:hypothetical protein